MRSRFLSSASVAACLVGIAVVACVGSEPLADPPPQADAGATPGSSPTEPAREGGTTGDGALPTGTSYCSTVAPAASAKETVFCEDFEGDYESRWTTTSEAGTLAKTDVDGFKALDVTLNTTAANDYIGPHLLWRKIPRAGAAEVSFDFMLLEAPVTSTGESGFLWFSRIGALGNVSVGFGGQLDGDSVEYGAIYNTGNPADFMSATRFTFAPKQWTRVTMRYASTADGAAHFVDVGTNPEYTASLDGAGLDLLENDGVFLGVFVKGAPAVVKARFAKVVIRVTAP